MTRHGSAFVLSVTILLLAGTVLGVENAPPLLPNSDATYQQLRRCKVSGEPIQVTNFVLNRDIGKFTFSQGTFALLCAVQGRVTGAVFTGQGKLEIAPSDRVERRNLSILTRGAPFAEEFDTAVLRFTDGTDSEVLKAGSKGTVSSGRFQDLLDESNDRLRKHLNFNLHARLLQDVLSSESGGLFCAFIHGRKFNDRMLFIVDPHGVPAMSPGRVSGLHSMSSRELPPINVAPEEVALITYSEDKFGIWEASHLQSEYAAGKATGNQQNAAFQITKQVLDTTIEKGGRMTGKARTTIIARANGLRVLPFALFPTLRVSNVTDVTGTPLAFIQEDMNDDPDFSVVLPKALNQGDTFEIQTTYSGKDAVTNEGGGNYMPVSREDWYPNNSQVTLGNYATYDLTFRVPKSMQVVGTGTLARESTEGDQKISVWASEAPMTVAGFNIGRFKRKETKITKPNFVVETYANDSQPDWVQALLHTVVDAPMPSPSQGPMHYSGRAEDYSMGTMTTTTMMKQPLAEAETAVRVFNEYFGPASYSRVAMTQQTACTFGQSWPALVYLPICSFFDVTVRHQLGLDFGDRGYWKSVTAHEVAHQWWGHTTGFNSYRDQWMSEGFADFSAAIYLQHAYGAGQFNQFWEDERYLLTAKTRQGVRAVDVGPVTLGYRLMNSRTGYEVPRLLIYPKGAYILHMIRMMMWSNKTGDSDFKAMMHDFTDTYRNKPASTEDFKATVEKHMTKQMDVMGDRKMDWFFDEYVYGTSLPSYRSQFSLDKGPEGQTMLTMKITQAGVDDNFSMLVPVYLEFDGGRVMRLGALTAHGNATTEQKVSLGQLKDRVKKVSINYYHDVLCEEQ